MKTCNTEYEPLIAEIVAELVGSRHVSLQPVPTYPDSVVYFATTDDRSVVFKAAEPGGRDRVGIALEAWACETAAAQGVPTPRVLALDTSLTNFPSSFFVTERARGRSLDEAAMSEADLDGVARQLGAYLRRLHEVRLTGFGWLDEDHYVETGQVRGSVASWRIALLENVPAALDYLAEHALSSLQDRQLREAIASTEPRLPDLEEGRLLHGDLGTNHVWVDSDRRITSIVDFGERLSGDWLWDLAEYEGKQVPQLLAGYGMDARSRGELEELLRVYWLVKAVPWAHKWHQRGEPQVITWLLTALAKASS